MEDSGGPQGCSCASFKLLNRPGRLRLAFGYRSNEILLEAPQLRVDDLRILGFTKYDTNLPRAPVARDMGPSLKGVTLPHGDPGCPYTRRDGILKRMGQPLPSDFTKTFLRLISEEMRILIKERNIKPIPKDAAMTPEEWLQRTNYPQWRKDQLLEKLKEIRSFLDRNKLGQLIHFMIKGFMKDEHYVDWKQVREIWARDDGAKLYFGPYFKHMEDVVYSDQLPEFIKHVPVRDRADYIYSRLYGDGYIYVATDFSSFESHFTKEMMEACEFVFYKHMLKHYPEVYNTMREVLQGLNRCSDKYFKILIQARRMSGEMNTSLGNGLSNLIFMRTISRLYGYGVPVGVVEGDDGLFRYKIGKVPSTKDFTDLGFNIKLEVFKKISDASFCGLLFDEDDREVISDPRKILASFGWTSQKYANASKKTIAKLIRCKSLSLAHAYPGCPIVAELARYGLRVTRSYNVRQFINSRRDLNMYEREKYLEAEAYFRDPRHRDELSAPIKEVGMGTRVLVERLYGIDIPLQLKIEEYLREKNDLDQIDLPEVIDLVPNSWVEYADRYILERDDDRKMDFTTIQYRRYLVS